MGSWVDHHINNYKYIYIYKWGTKEIQRDQHIVRNLTISLGIMGIQWDVWVRSFADAMA